MAEYLHNIDKHLIHKRNVLIVGCGINFMDVAGAEMLAREAQRGRTQRGNPYLCEIKPDVIPLSIPSCFETPANCTMPNHDA
ncbi:conserved hypothetical protein [delta proteobacterium NaphS2]|nr:conserved hypothetical protein [delta proteobacterium NaphS2]